MCLVDFRCPVPGFNIEEVPHADLLGANLRMFRTYSFVQTICANMVSIKDINGMDPREAEDIKKR